MHELSVCQALITQVQGIATQHGALAVKLIRLQIGPLSGVEASLLENAFPLASAGTVAENAVLYIDRLPVRVRCQQCGAETEAAVNRLICGKCGDYHTQLISGDEMMLASVELTKES